MTIDMTFERRIQLATQDAYDDGKSHGLEIGKNQGLEIGKSQGIKQGISQLVNATQDVRNGLPYDELVQKYGEEIAKNALILK